MIKVEKAEHYIKIGILDDKVIEVSWYEIMKHLEDYDEDQLLSWVYERLVEAKEMLELSEGEHIMNCPTCGTKHLRELNGTGTRIICLECGRVGSRDTYENKEDGSKNGLSVS